MNKTRDFDSFDAFAENYRAIHNQNVQITGADSDYFSAYRAKEILDREKSKSGPEITHQPLHLLDVGCGDGNAARFFKSVFTNMQITGIDISEAIVEAAKARAVPDATFLVYDGQHFPFADAVFDIVFMVGTFHHVDKKYHAPLSKECLRVLKPGGRYYNFEHNPWNPVTQKLVRDCVFDQDAVLVSAPYLHKLTQNIGFKQVKSRFTLFFPRHSFFKPFFGLEKYLYRIPLGGQYYVEAIKS